MRVKYLTAAAAIPPGRISIDGSRYRIDDTGVYHGWPVTRLRPAELPAHGLAALPEPPRLTFWQRLRKFLKG